MRSSSIDMTDECSQLRGQVAALCSRIPELAQTHPDLPTFMSCFMAEAEPIVRSAGVNRSYVERMLLDATTEARIPPTIAGPALSAVLASTRADSAA